MKHVHNLLSDYLDGDLNHETTRQVDEHLAGCPACCTRFRSLRRTVRFIQGNSSVDIHPGTAAAGLARFNGELMGRDASDSELMRVALDEWQRALHRPSPGDKSDHRGPGEA